MTSFLSRWVRLELRLASLLLAVTALIGCGGHAPDPAPPDPAQSDRDTLVLWGAPEFGPVAQVKVTGGIEFTQAPTGGDKATVLFQDFRVELQSPDAGPRGGAMATVTIPTEFTSAAGDRVRLKHDVRLAVAKSQDSRVMIIIDLGGTPEILTFPFGTEFEGPDTTVTVERIIKVPSRSQSATFMVLAERQSPTGSVLVSIDTYDLLVTRP